MLPASQHQVAICETAAFINSNFSLMCLLFIDQQKRIRMKEKKKFLIV